MTETIAGRRRLGRGLEALLGPPREEAERGGRRRVRRRPLTRGQCATTPQAPGGRARVAARGKALGRARARAARPRRPARRGGGRQGSRRPGALGTRRRGSGAGRPGAGPAAAVEAGARAGSRSAPHRGRAAPAPRHRCARHAPGEREGADPPPFLFERRPRAPARADSGSAVRRMKHKSVTIVVHTDGELESRQYRVPLWAFGIGKWTAGGIAVLVVLFFLFAGPITRNAVRAQLLDRRVARLEEENGRVQQLAAALNRAEANYQELRQLLGVKAPPEKVVARPDLPRALTVRARAPGAPPRFASDSATPLHWPLADGGFLTRGQVGPGDPAESHPGIDIAVPTGTAVRAAAAGVVAQAGTDPAYGLFVLLRHTAGYETMYGHASRLVVREGDSVVAGQVIALSGSSGRSTAPHLHFEIRREGKSLDPLTVVKQEN